MKLKEGEAIFDETIQYLLSIEKLEPLDLYDELIESVYELLSLLILQEGVDMSKFNSNTYNLENRLNHFGVYFGEFSELVDNGAIYPEFIVVNFLLIDGDETRIDRYKIMNPLIKYCGISSEMLPITKKCTVLNFVQYFFRPGEEIPKFTPKNYTFKKIYWDKLKEIITQSRGYFITKKNMFQKKYAQNSLSFIDENDGKIEGKKPKRIKRVTRNLLIKKLENKSKLLKL